jgi:hypothetical protein
MITDEDLSVRVRESLAGMHMQTSVETIIRDGRARRRRRRLAFSGVAVTAGVTAVLVGTTVSGSDSGSPTQASNSPSGSASSPQINAQPVAFTLTSAPGGATSLTLYKGQHLDPDALRQALAQHGIPALVTVGKFCRTNAQPANLGDVLTFQDQPRSVAFTINPAAIPSGVELSVGYFSHSIRLGLIDEHAPLSCDTGQQPAVHESVGSGKIR